MDQVKGFGEVFERKEDFLDYKNVGLKTLKICLFPKGLVHGFCLKMELLPSFVFMQNGSRKSVLWSFEKKRNFFRL